MTRQPVKPSLRSAPRLVDGCALTTWDSDKTGHERSVRSLSVQKQLWPAEPPPESNLDVLPTEPCLGLEGERAQRRGGVPEERLGFVCKARTVGALASYGRGKNPLE